MSKKTYLGIVDNGLNNGDITYPSPKFGFSPSEDYPEYQLGNVTDEPNIVYNLIREGFH